MVDSSDNAVIGYESIKDGALFKYVIYAYPAGLMGSGKVQLAVRFTREQAEKAVNTFRALQTPGKK